MLFALPREGRTWLASATRDGVDWMCDLGAADAGAGWHVPWRQVRVFEDQGVVGSITSEADTPGAFLNVLYLDAEPSLQLQLPCDHPVGFEIRFGKVWACGKYEFFVGDLAPEPGWTSIDLPDVFRPPAKELDGLVGRGDSLILVDDIIEPKYFLEYAISATETNFEDPHEFFTGPYGHVREVAVGPDYFVVRADHASGWTGPGMNVTAYDTRSLMSRAFYGALSHDGDGMPTACAAATDRIYMLVHANDGTCIEWFHVPPECPEEGEPAVATRLTAGVPERIQDLIVDPRDRLYAVVHERMGSHAVPVAT